MAIKNSLFTPPQATKRPTPKYMQNPAPNWGPMQRAAGFATSTGDGTRAMSGVCVRERERVRACVCERECVCV